MRKDIKMNNVTIRLETEKDYRAVEELTREAFWNVYKPGAVHLSSDQPIHYLRGQDAFTDYLAGAGYECGLSGKWHMGDSAVPQAGFTYWHTTANGGENYFYPVVFDQEQQKMVLKRNYYVTDYIADQALNFFDVREKDKPFCLSVHFTAPHSPWAEKCHPKQFYDLYRDCPMDSIPFEEIHKWVPHADQPFEEWKKKPHPGVLLKDSDPNSRSFVPNEAAYETRLTSHPRAKSRKASSIFPK